MLALMLAAAFPAVVHAQTAPVSAGDEIARAVADSAAIADSLAAAGVPQRDIMDLVTQIIGRRKMEGEIAITPRPGLSVTLLPSIGYNPAYGAFIGVSAAVGGWLGDPKTTTTSQASAGASYSTTGQVSIQLKSDFFTPGNGWDLKGDWRYLDTSQPTYGIGPVIAGQPRYPMEFLLLRLYETVYRRIGKGPMYVGFGYHFNRYTNIVDTRADAGESTPFTVYSLGYPTTTTASGVSANVLYETRDNTINASRGVYWNSSLRFYNQGLGSDADWQMMWSDLRAYHHLPGNSRNTLAIWNYMWFTFGRAPYLDLPSVGWDTYGRSGRGYIQGRIRGPSQIYTEGEYRMVLTKDGLLGAVGFVNLMATTIASGQFAPLDPGGGVGARVKFNKRTNTNLTVDSAWGQHQKHTWFFGMQEVF